MSGDAFRSAEGVAIERYRVYAEVLAILNGRGEWQLLMRELLRVIKRSLGFDAVGLRIREGEDYPYYEVSGFSEAFVAAESTLCAHGSGGELLRDASGRAVLECMCGTIIDGRADPKRSFFTPGGSFWTNSTTALLSSTTPEERQGRTRNRCNSAGFESVALVPIKADDVIIGLLQCNDHQTDRLSMGLVTLLERIGDAVGAALHGHWTETALREREATLRHLVESNADAMIVVDGSGRTRFINPAGCRLFGRDRESLVGECFGFPVAGANKAEIEVVSHTRGLRVVEMRVSRIFWEGEDADLASLRDVTEARRVEALLSAQSRLAHIFLTESDSELYSSILEVLRELTDSEHGVVVFCDAERWARPPAISSASWAACRLPDSAIRIPVDGSGDSIWDRAARERRGVITSEPGEVPVGHVEIQHALVVPLLLKDRVLGHIGLANRPGGYLDAHRVLIEGLCAFMAPVLMSRLEQAVRTRERRQARLHLSRLARDLTEAQAISKTGSWEYDIAADKPAWSQQMFALFRRDTSLGEPSWVEHRGYVHPEDWDRLDAAVAAGIGQGEPYDLECRIVSPGSDADAEPTWARTIGMPVRNDDGEIVKLRGTTQDITEQKQHQAEMRALEQQFRQAQKLETVGQLAGGVAHDFNNLLTVINSYAGLAIEGLREGDPLRDDIAEILQAGERATRLTRQLLAFSRKQVMKLEVFDLNAVVKDMTTMLQRLISEHITFTTALAGSPALVESDKGQIEQVIMNLAVNARDAMPAGGSLKIETSLTTIEAEHARRHSDPAPGQYVLLSVSDTGSGMDADSRERAFEPFYTTKEKGQGTGLGLSMVYGIIKQSEGDIRIDSEVGRGTCFSIYLPQVTRRPITTRQLQQVGTRRGTETILVVEDEDAVRMVAQRILSAAGYEVLAAANGGEALLTCERRGTEIQLVITDIVMPQMSGPEFVDRLATVSPGMKVIFMSGYTDGAIIHQRMIEDNQIFLSKPFSAAEMLDKVRLALERLP